MDKITQFIDHHHTPEDTREDLWAKIETEIQRRIALKDTSFHLDGPWKTFIREQNGYKVFSVNGHWLRNNMCVYFQHGGHGFVHEFIPMDEIWVSAEHYKDGAEDLQQCGCSNAENRLVSQSYFDSTVVHEIVECSAMKQGVPYWQAHQLALQKERELGLLADPYRDVFEEEMVTATTSV